MLPIEIAYALPNTQFILVFAVPAGTMVAEAIARSGILQQHPDIDLQAQKVGIFGQVVSLEQTVAAHDRIEIYRPLSIDPKQKRRIKAAKSK